METIVLRFASFAILVLAATPSLAAQEPPFSCPSAGVVITTDAGDVYEYKGSKSSDDTVCLTRINRSQTEWVYGLWRADHVVAPKARDELSDLFPLEVGKKVTFTNAQDGKSAWLETFKVLRHEGVVTAAGTFDSFVIERTETSFSNGFEMKITYWYATKERVFVKKHVELVRGTSTGSHRSWEAEKVTFPAA